MISVLGCITQQHDLRLVALAVCICAVACFTTMTLLARAREPGRSTGIWLITAAGMFGAGVWSLHFVAMLAFMPKVPIAYDVATTIWSVVIAVAGTLVALQVWRQLRFGRIGGALGGILLGLTVAAMHYVGIAAMRLPGTVHLAPDKVVASALTGIAFAVLALIRAGPLASLPRQIEASCWLALCVCGLHFTGMDALTIQLGPRTGTDAAVLGSGPIAVAVGAVSLAILLLSLASAFMVQHLSERAVLELRRIRLLSSLSHEVMMIHRNGIILEVNEAGERLFGQRASDLLGSDIGTLISAAADHPHTGDVYVRTAYGRHVPVELSRSAISYEGRPATAIALRDMSERRRDEERIRHLAHHDSLTDLPNRFLLADRLAHALQGALRDGGGVALFYLDLDRFKPINDLLGHASGDALLVQVSLRVLGELQPTDTLARVGGDEFVVVSTDSAPPGKAAVLAGKLIDVLARPFDLSGRQVEIGVSIGIALSPADGTSQENLLRAADTALYRVKDDKRGSFRFYETAMDEHLQERRVLEQDLRHAVDRNELELHYQPLANCRSGHVDGFEALIRWRHPSRGLILPVDFIALAEETGQIDKIGQWVIETACRAAVGWSEPCWVAVNVSPLQFRQMDLPRVIGTILAQTGLPANRLEIEVTESIFITNISRTVATLSALRALGVCVSLDDFGTGYSSLSYLRAFAFDKIKIDKSFILGLGQTEDAAMIVRAIIGLGHNLGLSISAEGIETQHQWDIVQAEGCDYAQGYLLGRPMRNQINLVQAASAELAQAGRRTVPNAARAAGVAERTADIIPFAAAGV